MLNNDVYFHCSKQSLGAAILNVVFIKYAFINGRSTHYYIMRIDIILIIINIIIISFRKHTDLQAKE